MKIEIANRIVAGRAVGTQYVVTRRDEGNSGIVSPRFDTREEAQAWIDTQEEIARVEARETAMLVEAAMDNRLRDAVRDMAGVVPATRQERRLLAAACPRCGGWTSSGGMSQHARGPDGCVCHTTDWNGAKILATGEGHYRYDAPDGAGDARTLEIWLKNRSYGTR